jgi:hypothetical protein
VHTEARQLAVRSYLTAGVALVGASVIAVSPMAPPMPDIHLPAIHLPSIQSAEVDLAALANPFAAYQQVFDAANKNLQAILGTAADNPTPILTKVLSNQITGFQALLAALPTSADALKSAVTDAASADPSSSLAQLLASQPSALQTLVTALQTAFGQVSTALTTTVPSLLQGAFTDLTDANVEGAVNNVLLAALAPVFPLANVLGPALGVVSAPLQSVVDAINTLGPVGTILANPLQNVVNVLNIPTDQPFNVLLGVSGLIGPLVEAPAAAGAAIQGVINAIGTGDPASVLSAVVNAPAVIAGGVLNGGLGPDIGDLVAPGLGLPPGLLHAVFGGVLSPALSSIPGGTLVTSGTLAGLQTLQGLIADALKPPAIPVAAKADTVTLASTDTVAATPTALPSLKSALVGIKTPLALKVKPSKTADAQDATKATDATTETDTKAADTKTPDTKAGDTKAGDTKAADTKPAASDAGDTGNQPAKTPGKHRASAGDNGGKHARSHDSSGAGKSGKSGSGSGRHHAA